MSEKIFVDGMSVFAKNDKSPDWAGPTLETTIDQHIAWLNSVRKYAIDGRLRFQVNYAKTTGKPYLSVDLYKYNKQREQQGETTTPDDMPVQNFDFLGNQEAAETPDLSEIPF